MILQQVLHEKFVGIPVTCKGPPNAFFAAYLTIEEAVTPIICAPVEKDFEYIVRVNVAIPLAWAQVLKTTGAQHYDFKCRKMADCGVVNGLYNIAVYNEGTPRGAVENPDPSTHLVSWQDCDGMLKIMELANYAFDHVMIGEICTWLRHTMKRLSARQAELVRWQT